MRLPAPATGRCAIARSGCIGRFSANSVELASVYWSCRARPRPGSARCRCRRVRSRRGPAPGGAVPRECAGGRCPRPPRCWPRAASRMDAGRRCAAPLDQVLADQLVTGAERDTPRGSSMPVRQPGGGTGAPARPALRLRQPPACARCRGAATRPGSPQTGSRVRRPVLRARGCRGSRRPGCCASTTRSSPCAQDCARAGPAAASRCRAGDVATSASKAFMCSDRIRGPRRGTEAVITAPTRNRMGA